MNKTQAIKKFCFECAGDSNKEVTLCSVVTCPLWEYRVGARAGSKTYIKRLETARTNYPGEFTDLANQPETAPFFKPASSKTRSVGAKSNG